MKYTFIIFLLLGSVGNAKWSMDTQLSSVYDSNLFSNVELYGQNEDQLFLKLNANVKRISKFKSYINVFQMRTTYAQSLEENNYSNAQISVSFINLIDQDSYQRQTTFEYQYAKNPNEFFSFDQWHGPSLKSLFVFSKDSYDLKLSPSIDARFYFDERPAMFGTTSLLIYDTQKQDQIIVSSPVSVEYFWDEDLNHSSDFKLLLDYKYYLNRLARLTGGGNPALTSNTKKANEISLGLSIANQHHYFDEALSLNYSLISRYYWDLAFKAEDRLNAAIDLGLSYTIKGFKINPGVSFSNDFYKNIVLSNNERERIQSLSWRLNLSKKIHSYELGVDANLRTYASGVVGFEYDKYMVALKLKKKIF